MHRDLQLQKLLQDDRGVCQLRMNLLDEVPREVSLLLIGFDNSDFLEVNLVRLKGNN